VIVAIEKRTNKGAILLSHEDGWTLRVEPGDDVVLGRSTETKAPIPHVAADRKHARVRWSGADCTIEDLGSTSGTYVNDKIVHQPVVLAAGDVVAIGPFRVTVSKG
jgi:pSer/pThr/pTyr-binding forkhead associated (FHA) protein